MKSLTCLFVIVTLHALLVSATAFAQIDSLLEAAIKSTYKNPELTEQLGRQAYNESAEGSAHQAEALRVIGTSYYVRGDYDKALANFMDAVVKFEALGDTVNLIRTQSNLGVVYKQIEDYSLAIYYYRKALNIASPNDSVSRGRLFNNLGVVMNRQKKYDSAEYYYRNSLMYKRTVGDKKGVANTLTNLGTISSKLGDDQEAIKYFRQSMDLEKSLDHDEGIAKNLNNIAYSYLRLNQLDSARYFAKRGFDIGNRLGTKIQINEAAEILAKCAERRADFVNAFRYLKIHLEMKDSLMNEDVARRIGRLESRLELTKKNSEIELLKSSEEIAQLQLERRQKRIIWLIVILVLTLIGAIYIYFSNKQRHRLAQKLLQSEVNELRGQLKLFVEGEVDTQKAIKKLVDMTDVQFSKREMQILEYAFTDLSNSEIAEKTFVSVNTVKFHLRNIYTKMGVSNRQQIKEYIVQS